MCNPWLPLLVRVYTGLQCIRVYQKITIEFTMSLLAQSLLQGHRAVPQLGAALSALANVQLPWTLPNQCQQQQCLSIIASSLPRQQPQQQLQRSNPAPAVPLLQQHCQRHMQQLQHRLHGFHTSTAAHEKQLKDIMKLERLQHETADKVEEIWLAFHASSTTHIATVLSSDEHTILSARAAASPLFVLPLSKKPGQFQTLLLQWQPPSRLLFTTLEEFKQWGPQAPPHMTVQLYEDLKSSHGLVLARGDLINPQLINAAEGRTLLELARAFYRDAAAHQMVYAFNHNPAKFDFQALCRELGVNLSAPPAPTA